MTRLSRKNLMVDAEAVRDLARERGTSESEAVRDAVKVALGLQGMVDALKKLHEIGAFADYDPLQGWPPREATRVAEPKPRLRRGGS